jgi:hypothetical protein
MRAVYPMKKGFEKIVNKIFKVFPAKERDVEMNMDHENQTLIAASSKYMSVCLTN